MSANNSLYALSETYAELYAKLRESCDSDGVVDENVFTAVDAAACAFTEKATAVAAVYRRLDDDVYLYAAEIDRLTLIMKRLEAQKARVKAYLTAACEKTGTTKITGMHANISFRRSSKTDIYDKEALPEEYLRTKIVVEPNTDKIRNALLAGEQISGARLVEANNIQIK